MDILEGFEGLVFSELKRLKKEYFKVLREVDGVEATWRSEGMH